MESESGSPCQRIPLLEVRVQQPFFYDFFLERALCEDAVAMSDKANMDKSTNFYNKLRIVKIDVAPIGGIPSIWTPGQETGNVGGLLIFKFRTSTISSKAFEV